MVRRWAFGVVLVGVLGCARTAGTPKPSSKAASEAPGAIVFLSGALQGYLEPCGCSDNMPGGIDRAAHLVRQAQSEPLPVLYFDTGDALFTRPTLEPEEVVQEMRKAQALAESLTSMGVQGKADGPLDDVRGAAFLSSLALPVVARGGARTLPAGRGRIALITAQSAEELSRAAVRARADGAWLVLGAWVGPFSGAQSLVERTDLGVDALIAAHGDDATGDDDVLIRGPVPLLRPRSRGRSLLRLDVHYGPTTSPFELLKGQAEVDREVAGLTTRLALLDRQLNEPGMLPERKALVASKVREVAERRAGVARTPVAAPPNRNAFSVRFIPLEQTLPPDPAVKAIVARYDRDVAALNLAWAKEHGKDCAAPAKGEAAYVGNQACADCHADAFPVYRATKHAGAYNTLVQAKKQYRVDCIACHVIGIQQSGGVCRVDRVRGRENVGCESCHGPGSLHVADPREDNIRGQPGRTLCVGCHNPENSPHFDFAQYLPKILGPGHLAAPAAKNHRPP